MIIEVGIYSSMRDSYLSRTFAENLILRTLNFLNNHPEHTINWSILSSWTADYAFNPFVLKVRNSADIIILLNEHLLIPENFFEIAIEHINSGRKCVSGLFFLRDSTLCSCVYSYDEKKWLEKYTPNTLYQVYQVQTECLILNAKMFNVISQPPFYYRTDLEGNYVETLGEFFSKQCRTSNIKMFVDTNLNMKWIIETCKSKSPEIIINNDTIFTNKQ